MYYIGIDIGKNYHEASIVDSSGTQIGKSFRFSSNHKGADKLLSHIANLISNNDFVFSMEATGHYWYTIYSFLTEHGFTVYVINPIQSDCFRNFYIRQTKNDSKDSFLIAEVIRFGKFTTTKLADDDILSMRQLCRHRAVTMSERTEVKLHINTILEQIFPEYEKLFSEVWGSSSIAILDKYLLPENIANADTDELLAILKENSHNRFSLKKACEIKEAAKTTFGIRIAQNAFAFQLKQLLDKLKLFNEQIKQLDDEIISYYEKFNCYLHTIPSITPISAACILSEIGDISRFGNSSALVAYAGIDPTVRQSGEFNSNHNHMSKRGSSYLRHTLFLAASCCVFHSSPFYEYYQKKRSQGKHHLVAVGAVSRKLTTVVYAVLKSGKPYEPVKFV